MGSTEKTGKRKYTHEEKSLVILKSTLSRLPIYYCYLQEKLADGIEFVSSSAIAENLSLNPVQVRKDLASVSTVPGRPKRGFLTERAVLVGVGNLGGTLMQYNGFDSYGINIAAGFDINASLHGKRINGKSILPMDKFPSVTKRLNVHLGIIAVPSTQAQAVADMMIANGIRAIWNFAPTHVSVPRGVIIKNENLAASLAILSKELSKNMAAGKVMPF